MCVLVRDNLHNMLFETTVTVLLALAAGGCTDARPDGGLSFPDSAEVEVGQRNSDVSERGAVL